MPCSAPVAHATTAQSPRVSQQPTLLVETPVMTATTPTLGQTQNLTTHQSLVTVHRVITASMQQVKTQPTSAQLMSVRIATRLQPSRTLHESTTMPCWAPVARATTALLPRVNQQPISKVVTPATTATYRIRGVMFGWITHPLQVAVHRAITAQPQQARTQHTCKLLLIAIAVTPP